MNEAYESLFRWKIILKMQMWDGVFLKIFSKLSLPEKFQLFDIVHMQDKFAKIRNIRGVWVGFNKGLRFC
jgi:hypothetical protein